MCSASMGVYDGSPKEGFACGICLLDHHFCDDVGYLCGICLFVMMLVICLIINYVMMLVMDQV